MFGSVDTPCSSASSTWPASATCKTRPVSFTAFIPWTFAAGNTAPQEGHLPATGHDYLRLLAVSRLFLDNVVNLQASWVTQGRPAHGTGGASFGANDMGSTMIEENVVRAAGWAHAVTVEEMVRLVAAAGFAPVQRDTLYREVRRYPTV